MVEDKKYCVYCHTSPSGKKYVGITSQEPERRWRGGSGYYKTPFYNAIRKYGWENIEHEILENGLTHDEANEREMHYISLYNSKDSKHGYNSTLGGDGSKGRTPSDEVKKVLSEKCRWFRHTPEAIEKITEKAKENWTRPEFRERMKETHSGKNHYMYGKRMSPERRAQHSIAMTGRKHTDEWKRQASERLRGAGNPNYGRKFGADFCEIQRKQGIARMADPAARQHLRDCFERKQVEQYTVSGEYLASFDGLHEAERETGVRASNISLCCRGNRKSASGFVWKYA